MSAFWMVGIVLNLTLTGLILYWLIRQGKPKAPDAQATKTPPPATDPRKSAGAGKDAD